MNFETSEFHSRRCNVPGNLPEFIERFNKESNHYHKAADLYFFVDQQGSIFEQISGDSDRASFFQLISKITELFDDVMRYNNAGNQILERETKLQCCGFLMDSMTSCLSASQTTLELLLMLQTSLSILHKGYNHCKECELIYGDLLEQFKNQLADFFNNMQRLQEAMNVKFGQVLKPKLCFAQLYLLEPILPDLNKLCELVFSLDSPSGMELYRTLISLLETYKSWGRVDLHVDSILTGLFLEIISIGNEFKTEIKNTEKVPVHESRMFLFKLNVVKKIVQIFPDCIAENLTSCVNVILHLYELLLSCYHKLAAEDGTKCLKNILVDNISLMLSLFYSERTFLTSVLLLNFKEISPDLQMAHLLLKLSVLNFLHSAVDEDYLPERKGVIQNLFLVLAENTPTDDMKFVSLYLPLSLFKLSKRFLAFHQPENESDFESISIYQHAYLHLAEYSRRISDSDEQNLESFVIDFLLANSSKLASILLADIWVFRLRCNSAENLFTRCVSFSHRVADMPSDSLVKLVLKRMIKFLPMNLQIRLFGHDERLKDLDDQKKFLHRYGAPHFSNSSWVNKNIETTSISMLLDELKGQNFSDNQQLIRKACIILELCAVSISVLEIEEFLRFAEFATIMLTSGIYEMQISVLTFLRALNFKKFNDKDPLFSKVRSSLAVLYNNALRCKNYMIRLEAFSLFYIMAQFTEIRITQETIAKFPDLYSGVKAYVSETPQSGFISPKDKIELLEKQISDFDDKIKPSSHLSSQSKSVLKLLLPS